MNYPGRLTEQGQQLGALDPSRLGESHGLLAYGELREVDRALAVVVGLGS